MIMHAYAYASFIPLWEFPKFPHYDTSTRIPSSEFCFVVPSGACNYHKRFFLDFLPNSTATVNQMLLCCSENMKNKQAMKEEKFESPILKHVAVRKLLGREDNIDKKSPPHTRRNPSTWNCLGLMP